MASGSRSFSDSEVNLRNFNEFVLEQQRTKRNSGSHLTSSEAAVHARPPTEYYNYARTSLVDYEIVEDFTPSMNEITDPTTQTGRLEDVPEVFNARVQENVDIESKSSQQDNSTERNNAREEASAPEGSIQRPSLLIENAPGINEQATFDSFKTPVSSNENLLLEMETASPVEENNHQDHPKHSLTVHAENSILFPVSKVPPKENFLVPSEDFIGEPRCLALKKYATDDDMDDALELNFAEFDEDDESNGEQSLKSSTSKKVQKKNPNDMFLDDDDPNEVGDLKTPHFIDLANPKKNWEKPVVEKEEGELTPDLYSTTLSDGAEPKKTKAKKQSIQDRKESSATRETKKPERKESNQDFFLKINRCFRQLEREFCNMHVPRGSRRMIGQLQNTLCNVDRMKRRLTFLIDSAKNVSSDKPKNVPNPKDDKRASSRRGSFDEGRSKSSKSESGRSERVSSLLRDSLRSQREVEARMNRHIRRTAASVAYAGTKQEKQRIQSLFKRQMSMITQHVIQKKDSGKGQKAGGSRTRKDSETVPEGPKVPELKTLDEMEAFLAILKVQKSQKEEIIAKENQKKQQGPLRFTTKKGNPVVDKRLQPVLLVGVNAPQEDEQSEGADWEKQAEVLKAMSDKRKEILKNKKDYEEVKLLQEQLQKLTNMDTPVEVVEEPKNSNGNKFQNTKEQNNAKIVTKGGKEVSINEVGRKKSEEISSREAAIDSSSVKRDPKEKECIKAPFHPRSSDCEVGSREVIPEYSKKRKSRKEEENSSSETSESDSDSAKELKDQILKKRKINDGGHKLSSHKEYSGPERRSSRSRHRSNFEEATIIDGFDEKLPEELMSKKLLIVGDKNLALLNERFCLKVKGNQIYLKKVGRAKKAGSVHREQRNPKKSNQNDWKIRREKNRTIDEEEKARTTHSLQEMEEFLQQLRAKKKVLSEERDYVPKSNQQSREMKFMARIQAKRKAKLMACVSATPDISEKEAKFLKDLENRSRDPGDSPDTEKRKQKLMQKIREETDAIVLSQKQVEDDPLSDVKTFLNMIKEAESSNDEKSKQFYVSFSLKRSDVKQLENIATGKASSLTEESQKFLNSVRSKMRAKKAPALEGGDYHGQKD